MFKFKSWPLGVLWVLFLVSCSSPAPLKIGYAGELTGKRSELGVAGRDGAQLAVEHLNARGGIAGRPVELLVRDDRGDPETARAVDAELIESGVVAIVGHMTSGQALAVFDQINAAEVVLISPTSSSNEFNQQADFFFRVVPDTARLGVALARHVSARFPDTARVLGVCDLSNRSFTESYWRAVSAEFARLGGGPGQLLCFTSGETDLAAFTAEIVAATPEAVVFIASAVDTALLAQYGRQQGLSAAYFSSGWAQTDELLEKGGAAVEGLELNAVFNPTNTYPPFTAFRESFLARYRREPGFGAVYAYEAVLVLAAALEKTGGLPDGLPDALLTIRDFEGVQSIISLDAYGDVERDTYIAVIENGTFEIIATYPPGVD